MPTITEVEKLAFDLAVTERAVLATGPLESFPGVTEDDAEGIAEALRRDAEFDSGPTISISLAELNEHAWRYRS